MAITDVVVPQLSESVSEATLLTWKKKPGEAVTADKVCGEVESTKSVSEIFAPVTGKVVAVNAELVSAPELINSDPYGSGWLIEIEVPATPSGLLSAAEYGAITA